MMYLESDPAFYITQNGAATLSTMTLSITVKQNAIQHNDTQHSGTQYRYAECRKKYHCAPQNRLNRPGFFQATQSGTRKPASASNAVRTSPEKSSVVSGTMTGRTKKLFGQFHERALAEGEGSVQLTS
jgi:hypothetical protein